MEIKDYIIGILFSLVVGLGLWLSYEVQPRESTTTINVDSSTVTTRDTTEAPDTSRTVDPDSIPEPDTTYLDTLIITKVDTFKTKPDSQENSEYTKIRDYETTVSDSLISGVIKTTVQGYLVDQNLTYTPEYPLQVRVNTRTTVTKTVTKTLKPKGYPSIGVEASTNLKTLTGKRITGSWTFSNGNRITYGFDPVLKTHSLSISYNLRNLFR